MADLPWHAIHVCISIATAVVAWWTASARARKEEVSALRDRLDAEREARRSAVESVEKTLEARCVQAETRVGILERGYSKVNERLSHMPLTKDVSEQSALLRELRATIDALAGQFSVSQAATSTRLERIEDHLLHGHAGAR